MSWYSLARPALFTLDAERAHELTLAALARAPALGGWLSPAAVSRPATFCGLKLRNRVGLAAGLDKDGRAIEAFDRMGFGFIEVGTVTPRPQAGNPRPRLFRLPARRALINRMGFNNDGVQALVARLRTARRRCVVGVNIGKNADTPLTAAAADYCACLEAVYADADYVAVNLSSPNTPGLRELQDDHHFAPLLRTVLEARERLADRHSVRRPLLVKLAPDLTPLLLDRLADTAVELGIDGLIATNTTLARPGLEGEPLADEAGGLSGAPLRGLAESALRRLRARLGPSYPLVGVGGILGAADALERRAAGADVVQVYTGLIYRGPALVAELARAL